MKAMLSASQMSVSEMLPCSARLPAIDPMMVG